MSDNSIRFQIVKAIASRIEALGLVNKVYRNLDRALSQKNLPAIAVVSGEDSSEAQLARRSANLADVEIHLLVANSDDPELAADALEVAIHTALFDDVRLGGLANGETPLQRMGATWDFEGGHAADRAVVYRAGFRTSITHLEQSA